MANQQVTSSAVYTERYVAFIDILGFSNHVHQSEHSPDEAQKLIDILNHIARTGTDKAIQVSPEKLGADFRATSFSDCTVLSGAVSPQSLQYLLYRVSQFALDLLANGFLLRGAIAKGPLHHSETGVFGPAFLRAYGLEQNVAKYPRIIVDRGTHEDFLQLQDVQLNDFDKSLKPNLRYDDDGPVFLDIFSGYRNSEHIPYERLRVTAEACRASIQARLDRSIYDPSHFEKLRWLAIYWNGVRPQAEHIIFPAMRDFRRLNDLV